MSNKERKRKLEVFEDERGRRVSFAPKNKKGKDQYSHYSRGWMVPKLPCRIVIIGQSESGKSDIVKGILDGEIPELAMQYDEYCAFSTTVDDDLQTAQYREIKHPLETFPDKNPNHVICVFDDPPPHRHDAFKSAVNMLYCNGRHKGYSPILCCQEVGFLNKSAMGYVKQNSHLFIFPTKETPSLVKGLKQHGIINGDIIQDLHTQPHDYMYNILDKKRGEVYLLDRRIPKESETFKSQLRKLK